jgi:HPt (histidine-containing phosphotransfer) domain-containing protein
MEHKLGKSAKKLSVTDMESYYQDLKRECKSKGVLKWALLEKPQRLLEILRKRYVDKNGWQR